MKYDEKKGMWNVGFESMTLAEKWIMKIRNERSGIQTHHLSVLMNEKNKGRNQGENEMNVLGIDLGSPNRVYQNKKM